MSFFKPRKKSQKRMATSKFPFQQVKLTTKIQGIWKNYSQIDLATDSEKKLQYVLKMCQNGQKCYSGTEKKVKLKDSEYNKSSLVGQIDQEIAKEKSKLLVKCFVNSFTKIPPISARNVPKLPGMSLFEPRKSSNKRIAILKIALQYVKLRAKIGRRRFNYS